MIWIIEAHFFLGQSLILWDACSKQELRAGKHEGISHKTKTLRRSSYGLPDDEYFFLKLIDSSHKWVKLEAPHRI